MVGACKTRALMHAILEYTFVAIWGEYLFSTVVRTPPGPRRGPGASHDGGCVRPAVNFAPWFLAQDSWLRIFGLTILGLTRSRGMPTMTVCPVA